MHRLLADFILLLHLGFMLFVVCGGLPVLRWPRLAWLHLPAAAWGILVLLAGWICPLTPLENYFRFKAGAGGYQGSFIEHYLLPLIYPEGITRQTQIMLALGALLLNGLVYSRLFYRRRKRASGRR